MLARCRGIPCARRRLLAEPATEGRSIPADDEARAPTAGQFGARPLCTDGEALIGGSEGEGLMLKAAAAPSPPPPPSPLMLLRRLGVCA